jgi:predicted RNase H-like HicB family nuclease
LNRATFSIDGRYYGAFVTADPDGFLVESVDFLECWAIGSTLEEATGALAAQVALLLIAQPLAEPPPHSLDRRPDLRARFSAIVAKALAQPAIR